MSNYSPITIPPELVEQLRSCPGTWLKQITIAYQAGADQELEACCEWIPKIAKEVLCLTPWDAEKLRAARRPKPPSLRKQAYDALDTYIYGEPDPKDKERTYNTIRRALEQL